MEVSITNVPENLRSVPLTVRRYVIDSVHSNCLAAPDQPGGLEMVEERKVLGSDALQLTAKLEPMALCLWQIEKGAADRH